MPTKFTQRAAVVQRHVYIGEEQAPTSRNWLGRHLRKPLPVKSSNSGDLYVDDNPFADPVRPQTAPSAGTNNYTCPRYVPAEPPLARPLNKPPARPPRPDSNVMRDVNAWLEASMIKPAPQLMGGIPYWREGELTGLSASSEVRYAVPIIKTPTEERPSTSHSQHIKSFCRRARRLHVRMPTTKSKPPKDTVTHRKRAVRKSRSMPAMNAIPELDGRAVSPLAAGSPSLPPPAPRTLSHSRSLAQIFGRSTPALVSTSGSGWIRPGRPPVSGSTMRIESPSSGRMSEQESSMERRVNAVFGHPGSTVRRVPGTAHPVREESMGSLSDAPTYTSGRPPPSYRSRAASILTTSSFGCVNGMSSEQRQLNQHRTVQRNRGVKGKFRKLAQKAYLSK